jgi:hypothetical protein
LTLTSKKREENMNDKKSVSPNILDFYLKKFTGGGRRSILENPHLIKNFVVSTNGYIAMIVDKKLIGMNYTENKAFPGEKTLEILNPTEKHEKTKIKVLDLLDMVFDFVIPDSGSCSFCSGAGFEECGNLDSETIYKSCYECNGSGYLQRNHVLGVKLPRTNTYVGEQYLQTVVEALIALGVETVDVHHFGIEPVIFEAKEGVSLIIMPRK